MIIDDKKDVPNTWPSSTPPIHRNRGDSTKRTKESEAVTKEEESEEDDTTTEEAVDDTKKAEGDDSK
jgi:hypothetical protein